MNKYIFLCTFFYYQLIKIIIVYVNNFYFLNIWEETGILIFLYIILTHFCLKYSTAVKEKLLSTLYASLGIFISYSVTSYILEENIKSFESLFQPIFLLIFFYAGNLILIIILEKLKFRKRKG